MYVEESNLLQKTVTVSVSAYKFEDFDNSLEAAAEFVAQKFGFRAADSDTDPRWDDDSERRRILVDVPVYWIHEASARAGDNDQAALCAIVIGWDVESYAVSDDTLLGYTKDQALQAIADSL